jgi:HlyD family secretion protein
MKHTAPQYLKSSTAFIKFSFIIPVLAIAAMTGCRSGKQDTSYDFAVISRGVLEKTVSSSGSLKPVSTVKVLPRMSGKVEKINADYNDIVRKGDVIAELNTDMLRLQREQQLAQVIKSRANYELQAVNYRNQQALAGKNLISEYELKTGKTTLDIQAAELSASEASLKVIETEINQYAFITSPIDGIVLERNINEGDTVVDSSSSNSSSIFTLAENLEEMQIESWVGELDIASIYQGQAVRFTLESLPGRNFSGIVESKRLMPSVQDNVVSYNVIISVNNKDGSLLPGMTCMVEFIEERNENILIVPNAALRYQPTGLSAEEIADKLFNARLKGMSDEQRIAAIAARNQQSGQTAGTSQAASTSQNGIAGLLGANAIPGGGRMRAPGGQGGGMGPGGAAGQGGAGASGRNAARSGRAETLSPPRPLWYIGENGKPEVMLVRTGISNGSFTEVRSIDREGEGSPLGTSTEPQRGEGSLEGMQVILREKVR